MSTTQADEDTKNATKELGDMLIRALAIKHEFVIKVMYESDCIRYMIFISSDKIVGSTRFYYKGSNIGLCQVGSDMSVFSSKTFKIDEPDFILKVDDQIGKLVKYGKEKFPIKDDQKEYQAKFFAAYAYVMNQMVQFENENKIRCNIEWHTSLVYFTITPEGNRIGWLGVYYDSGESEKDKYRIHNDINDKDKTGKITDSGASIDIQLALDNIVTAHRNKIK